MAQLVWDAVTTRFYETGVSNVALYIPDGTGAYANGYAWSGVVSITESPSGAEPSPQYADNIKYLNLYSNEEFGLTIEAFMWPEEFEQCDGTASPAVGVSIGQQARKPFGLAYKTLVGNDAEGTDHGYKLHLAYGCQASPSEKGYSTVNDSPEAVTFSWEVTTTPVAVTDLKPTSLITIDSRTADPAMLAAFEIILFGDGTTEPSLPLPDAVVAAFTV